MSESKWFRRLTIAFLLLLFAVNIYRAWTQAITTDEAFSFANFPAVRPINLFHSYGTSYHVLHTMLVFLSVQIFGLSEFTLRLPSVLACALYFAAVYCISRFLFGVTPMLLLSAAVLTLNPLLLDHMSVARGYGMGLAFFSCAFYQALLYKESPRKDRILFRVAIFQALSVAANLTFLFPSLALTIVLAAIVIGDRSSGGSIAQRTWRVVDNLAGPWLVTAFLFLALPLSHIPPRSFSGYMEAGSARAMVDSLLGPSLHYRDCDLNESPACIYPILYGIGFRAAQILSVACVAAIVILLWKRREIDASPGLLVAGTLSLTIVFVLLGSAVFLWSYPWVRTALFFLFLVPVCLLVAGRWLWSLGPRARPAAWLWSAGLFALVVITALEFDTRYYIEWRFDAGDREIIQRIVSMHGAGNQPARIAAGFPLSWSMNLYRQMYRLAWLEPVELKQPEKGYDYYVLRHDDAHFIHELGLRTVYVHQLSGAILATP
ncbi:MAG TPA: hypothetical protein VEU96_30545 [Bryobacteraceae bacterium]|nr:hypothetical protein [Bryobacteraceae bacterium]